MLWLAIVTAGQTAFSPEMRARLDFVEKMFHQEAVSLVRLARLFTDDRAGAEDIVQEAFIRLYHATDRIEQGDRSAAYLRSIVLNLARDQNRRGLLSLRHQDSMMDRRTPEHPEEVIIEDERHNEVIDALNGLPNRQRDCLVLRFYSEMSEREIAETLGISPNSVKTHCQRGMATLSRVLEVER